MENYKVPILVKREAIVLFDSYFLLDKMFELNVREAICTGGNCGLGNLYPDSITFYDNL